jgi:hypothetical protein
MITGVWSTARHERGVEQDPGDQHAPEAQDEAPPAAERGHPVREPLAERELARDLGVDVRGQDLVAGEALDHLPLELAQLSPLAREDPLDVLRAVARQVVMADEAVVGPARVLAADLLDDARPHDRRAVELAAARRRRRGRLAHDLSSCPGAPSERPTAAASAKTTARFSAPVTSHSTRRAAAR